MPLHTDRSAIFAQIAKRFAADGTLLLLLSASYQEPSKTRLEEELSAMIPPEAAPFIRDVFGDFSSYCGYVPSAPEAINLGPLTHTLMFLV